MIEHTKAFHCTVDDLLKAVGHGGDVRCEMTDAEAAAPQSLQVAHGSAKVMSGEIE